MSKLSRWAVGALGLAVIAGVQAVMALEGLSWKAAILAFVSASGGALFTALQNFDRNLLRKDELPKWMADFLNGDASSVPPSASDFLDSSEPLVREPMLTPEMTTGMPDLDQ